MGVRNFDKMKCEKISKKNTSVRICHTPQKWKFFIKDLVKFTEEILDEKLHFYAVSNYN